MTRQRLGIKSDLVESLEGLVILNGSIDRLSVEVIILDGAAVVNMLIYLAVKNFSEYVSQIFFPFLAS